VQINLLSGEGKFIHRVPVGAMFPVRMFRFMLRESGCE
jgi:hypothetical protein